MIELFVSILFLADPNMPTLVQFAESYVAKQDQREIDEGIEVLLWLSEFWLQPAEPILTDPPDKPRFYLRRPHSRVIPKRRGDEGDVKKTEFFPDRRVNWKTANMFLKNLEQERK